MKLMTGLVVVSFAAAGLDGHDGRRVPSQVTFSTVSITDFAIEGLTGDENGTFYTTGRAPIGTPCPVWRIDAHTPGQAPTQIGSIGNPTTSGTPNVATGCNPSGITQDRAGNFFVADANLGGVIWRLTPANMHPTDPFATGVPGTNGIAFDRDGNLWTGDGTTGQGRVWKIAIDGLGNASAPVVMFRIQPMRNSSALGGTVAPASATDGVGRQVRSFLPGTLANTAGGQDLVANGVAFDEEGNLFVADTARGALWKVQFDSHGDITSPMGCDTTFTANTLCLDAVFVAHPYLEGTDGIALDRAGNIWNAANERNAIVVVTPDRRVIEVFRNAPNSHGLRNSADDAAGNSHILETPTSPFLSGHLLCVAQSDGDRRDNSPRAAGEINAGGPVGKRGKISCMDQPLAIPGLPLPVR